MGRYVVLLLRPGVVVVLLLPSEDGFAVGEKEVVLLGGGLLLLLLRGCGFSFAVKAGECLLLCVGTSSFYLLSVGMGYVFLMLGPACRSFRKTSRNCREKSTAVPSGYGLQGTVRTERVRGSACGGVVSSTSAAVFN